MNLLTWLWSAELGRQQLALLAWCMVIVYALTTWLVWRLFDQERGNTWLRRLSCTWMGDVTAQGARLVYYLGVPAALLWRDLLVEPMGIPVTIEQTYGLLAWHWLGLDTEAGLAHLVVGLAWGVGVLAGLVGVRLWHRHSMAQHRPSQHIPWWVALREGLLMQTWWATWRGCVSVWTADPLLIGLGGFALTAAAWLLNPTRRHRLFDPAFNDTLVRDWMLALCTAILSMYVRELWLLVALHTLWLGLSDRALPLSMPTARVAEK